MKSFRIGSDNVPAIFVFSELEPADAETSQEASSRLKKRITIRESRDAKAPGSEHIRSTTLSFSNMHQHGELLVNFMKARKRVFIDQLQWHLNQAEGMEYDQYDTPQCRWVVVHEFGEVFGGVRLLPTTATCGPFSYMLRDAQRGILTSIPSDVLLMEAPVADNVWEATRLFITEQVPANRRQSVQQILLNELSKSARELGATHVIGIVPAVWSRWLRRLEMGAVSVGPRFSIDGSLSQAALFNVMKNMV